MHNIALSKPVLKYQIYSYHFKILNSKSYNLYISNKILVIRNNKPIEINTNELLVGDIVIFMDKNYFSNIIPSDCIVLYHTNNFCLKVI